MNLLSILRAGSALVLAFGIALGFLSVHTIASVRLWTSAANNAVMSYTLAERALQVDLVDTRAGPLRSYAPVNTDLAKARAALADLAKLPKESPAEASLVKLIEKTRQEELLVERFERDNTVLQKELMRLHIHDGMSVDAQNSLPILLLRSTRDTSGKTIRDARAAVGNLPPASDRTRATRLAPHARRLMIILPEIDTMLHGIRLMHMDSSVEELRSLLRQETRARAAVVQHLEILLIATLMILGFSLIAIALVQRQRTRELKAQAANARLSAAIATPLIDTDNATFAARVRVAVHSLAIHIGAKRLQLVVPGLPSFSHVSWPDDTLDADWLRKLAAAAEASNAWQADRVMFSHSTKTTHRVLKDAMRHAGIDDLVMLRVNAPVRVLIGFEPEGLASAQRRDHIAGVASAIVAIAHGARRDIMELERARLERVHAQGRRMEMIGAMASGVAHNFNNIIAAIGGFAERGQGCTQGGSPARHHFDEIQGAVRRACDLVDDILNYAKQGHAKEKQALDLLEVLAQTIRLLKASARDDDAFRLYRPAGRYSVFGLTSGLQQVFLNICRNAARVSGGRPVKILSRRLELAHARRFSHGTLPPGTYIVVSVTDCGPGIVDSVRRRVFEPFFTTKSGGTGLGLSTAWEIVQDHAGTIDVENSIEGGACFSVWLPELQAAPSLPIVGHGDRILLLTEPSRITYKEELLAAFGFEPLGCSLETNGDELRKMVDQCDAVLVASQHQHHVQGLVRLIGPILGKRPLLLASPAGRALECAIPSLKLAYPIQSGELLGLLASVSRDPRMERA